MAVFDTKVFYASENGIPSLKDALKSVNSNFPALTAEEKGQEFKRIIIKCRAVNDKTSEVAPPAPDIKENPVCVVLKDISESLENFRKKRNFLLLVDVSACEHTTHLCDVADDVTKEFIDEYNGAKNSGLTPSHLKYFLY